MLTLVHPPSTCKGGFRRPNDVEWPAALARGPAVPPRHFYARDLPIRSPRCLHEIRFSARHANLTAAVASKILASRIAVPSAGDPLVPLGGVSGAGKASQARLYTLDAGIEICWAYSATPDQEPPSSLNQVPGAPARMSMAGATSAHRSKALSDAREAGDTLFTFLMIELSSSEGLRRSR